MAETLMDVLVCPDNHAPLSRDISGALCRQTGQRYRYRHGFLDLAPDVPEESGLSWQRAMEAPLISGIYERYWRPAITALGSPIRYEDEEAWVRRWHGTPEGLFLDLACGTGKYVRLLCELSPRVQVVGLDLSFSMLAICRRSLGREYEGRVCLARASALALPLADGVLAGANCFGAMHLFPDPGLALRELCRVMQSGAVLTVMTSVRRTGGKNWRADLVTRSTKFYFFEEDELAGLAAQAGLKLLAMETHGMLGLLALLKPPV